ncbi:MULTISPECIES: AraC family transcriptional regulator [Aquitalea]|uniref:AraC family transcriptional regulator n=1 Tax=Aquitalea TaxID=407217 RepID=UPI001359A92E|nr:MULTISPECIES: AraC family transcriptional regulator [Aquitalea]
MSESEYSRFFRADDIAPLECLDAFYREQVFAPHFHEEYVVNALLAGAQAYRHRGGNHIAGVGALVLMNPGEVHTGECAHQQGWAYRGFYPSAALICQLAADISGQPGVTPYFRETVVFDPPLAAQLNQLHQLLRDSRDALQRESALYAVFSQVVQRHMLITERRQRPWPQAVERARQMLADCVADNLSLATLAEAVGLSPWQLNRQFSRHLGLPPVAWRNQLRVVRARQLLAGGHSPAMAAQALGFSDQPHLTRVFRQALGITPAAYQRSLRR